MSSDQSSRRAIPIPPSRPRSCRVMTSDGPSAESAWLAAGGQRRSIAMPADHAAGRRARSLAAAACADWGLGVLVDDVEIVVGELTQNAVRHATCVPLDPRGRPAERAIGVGLALWARERRLIVWVRDGDPRPPVRRPLLDLSALDLSDSAVVAALEESGRGVWAVEKLADRFGWHPLPPVGKVVWCSFTTPDARG